MSANAQRVFNVPKKGGVAQLAIGLTVTAITVVGIYFGVMNLKGQSKEKAVNPAGSTPSTTGTGSPPSTTPPSTTPSTVTTPTPTSVCTTPQNSVLSSAANLTAWLTPYSQFLAANQPPAPITTTLAAVNTKIAEVDAMKACLAEKSAGIAALQSRNTTLSTNQATLEQTIEQRKADIQIAMDRALLAMNPNYNRSYYDGWFPLTRPLRESTIPILIATSLFFMSMAFFSVLAFMGIDTRILLPSLGTGASTPVGQQAKQPLFLVTMGLLVVITGLMIYAFTKTNK